MNNITNKKLAYQASIHTKCLEEELVIAKQELRIYNAIFTSKKGVFVTDAETKILRGCPEFCVNSG